MGLEFDLLGNLDICRLGLLNWERSQFGSVKKQIKEYKDRLEKLQKEVNTPEVKQIRSDLKLKLEEVLDREEILWNQRAKTQRLTEGL